MYGSVSSEVRLCCHVTAGIIRITVHSREDLSNLYTSLPVSYSEAYPDVRKPDPVLSPCLLAARWQSHDLYGEQMPGLAADLLEVGYDTPAVRRLAGEINIACSADAEPLVGRMFCELGVRYPMSETQAKLIVTRQIAREVIAGNRNAWAAASHLEITVWGWHTTNPTLQTIFAINDAIDWEPKYRRPLEDLRRSLLDSLASLARLKDEDVVD